VSDESGASAVEYGLIVFAIAATVTAIIFSLGMFVRDSYNTSCDKVASEITSSTC